MGRQIGYSASQIRAVLLNVKATSDDGKLPSEGTIRKYAKNTGLSICSGGYFLIPTRNLERLLVDFKIHVDRGALMDGLDSPYS